VSASHHVLYFDGLLVICKNGLLVICKNPDVVIIGCGGNDKGQQWKQVTGPIKEKT